MNGTSGSGLHLVRFRFDTRSGRPNQTCLECGIEGVLDTFGVRINERGHEQSGSPVTQRALEVKWAAIAVNVTRTTVSIGLLLCRWLPSSLGRTPGLVNFTLACALWADHYTT